MTKRLEKFLFILLLIFVPVQTGKHFWPYFSYISGIRVDYLSPTFYIIDGIVLLLFLTFIFGRKFKAKKNTNSVFHSLKLLLSLVFILVIVLQIFIARQVSAHVLFALRICEFLFLGYFASVFLTRKKLSLLIYSLSFGGIFSSLLAVWQFLNQSSIGGIFYFFGERTFSQTTIGIAKINIGTAQFLRPYATFPHPNVLALFLLVVAILILVRIEFEKNVLRKTFLIVSAIASSAGLFLTFSRSIIICFLIIICVLFFQRFHGKIQRMLFALAILPVTVLYFFLSFPRFSITPFLLKDLSLRNDLLNIGVNIFSKYPVFGVGLNNFFYYENAYQKIISPVFLQPIHNIYFLALVQLGVVGFIPILAFLFFSVKILFKKTFRQKNREIRQFYLGVFLLLIASLVIGFSDHFLITLEQGMLLFALLFGLVWSNIGGTSKESN
ncbi:MAG: hypothetical protein COX79_02565 [Candidatus Levybacteria bacterium CG_4_10_14_0_2_um_filter_36_16]|nr:MAG: hypothetical protein AUK12_04925 [Candidatus Levybacteria bacterium CG2_30_37_29]PIR79228.1 MAG: hypothetical protein COU26_02265 [Candidatus Levybacteria bacterium CG10_big_fil_rev_8_21_14_0_10_36_30]PIZ97363.1 MAG: hypothetical protein COX79_02565 [Candidatus Levybacteria bacterium CG_4_10_14_0_2_um_filter_36_16]